MTGARIDDQRSLLGTVLVNRQLISPRDLNDALRTQSRTGGRLGEILVHRRVVTDDDLARSVAEQEGLELFDSRELMPLADPERGVPEPFARYHRLVPVALDEASLTVVSAERVPNDVVAELELHARREVRTVIASERTVEALLAALYLEKHLRDATTRLAIEAPEESASEVITRRQLAALVTAVSACLVAFALSPMTTLVAVNACSVVFYTAISMYKLRLMITASRKGCEISIEDAEVAAVDERDLPVYTILVPLYREANVLPGLICALTDLDYPPHKLDIKLLLEADDVETIRSVQEMSLPPQFRAMVVPDGRPRTKPRACNYGLIHATGELVVIYDAEDRPERDQLKKVFIAFSKADPSVRCIQSKLNYFNRNQNVLTRWFTSEYSMWFDLMLPGLAAHGHPIPLGGTSNHFYTSTIVELGAWDPFNVTEDADLGVRLHKSRFKTALINSTTYEEANSQVFNWLRQRSRWVKGYIQTWLVHMRHPLLLRRQIGWRSWVSFQMIIGGAVATLLLNPVYWLLTLLWLLTQLGVIRSVFPGFVYFTAAAGLYAGNFAFMYLNVLGSLHRKYFNLATYAILSPIYWALMSIGAWKGFIQLLHRPFYWEKTLHGLQTEPGNAGPSGTASADRRPAGRGSLATEDIR